MRLLITNLLATAVLLFGATSASAYAIYFDLGGVTIDSTATSQVAVDIHIDIGPGEAGVELLSVAVLGDGATVYNGGLSSNPSYILFSPFGGKGLPSVYLVPSQTPMQTWPAPPPGAEQVNVNYQEVNLGTTRATGLNILLATLVFDVTPGATGSLALSISSGGNILRVNGSDVAGTVALGAPINFVPEPTTAVLVALGLVGLGVAGRRRA